MLAAYTLEIIYLVASLTFILGLKMLSHPQSARTGNLLAAFGMTLAILATIFLYEDSLGNRLGNYGWMVAGLMVGTLIGLLMAKKVKMTAMPQMVSFFNGMGGACAAVIGLVEYNHHQFVPGTSGGDGSVAMMLAGLVIGSVSFSGSMIAYGKLEGKIGDKALPGNQFINIGLLISVLVMLGWLIFLQESSPVLMYLLFTLALLYGILFVIPIGGADMPVVISLLNSFTGVAAAFGGFLYSNQAMLTGGILVGSAGTILTILMCKAMNRSLLNVIIGSFGGSRSENVVSASGGTIKEISPSDLAVQLKYAQKVAIVPGYGLAVAQAQHLCHDIEKLLESDGVEVVFAIHPVAGRMPGHMNVLLAEADIPYEKLQEMEEVNPGMARIDVVLVIGANDVVNPAARNDPSSPIFGMPILDVDHAKMTVVLKRSMGAGYAGIENELFFYDKTRMLFGDAKDSLQKILSELKSL
jgi:H+-translocating NAD(P) transhydrogenase subunit beta